MLNTENKDSMVRRVLVEKREGFDLEAKALKKDLVESLHIDNIENLRILNRYDVEGISEEVYENAAKTIFSEPNLDVVYYEGIYTKFLSSARARSSLARADDKNFV